MAVARQSGREGADLVSHDEAAPSLSEALAALYTHSAAARLERTGRELTVFEAAPGKIGRMVDLLLAGNYRETAATIAGVTSRAVRLWMERAEAGDVRYVVVADLVRLAEALAEASAVSNVRRAGRDPRFWAAEMTYLERRHPHRWARRQDDASTPKVVVQIGALDADVQINVPVADRLDDERRSF